MMVPLLELDQLWTAVSHPASYIHAIHTSANELDWKKLLMNHAAPGVSYSLVGYMPDASSFISV